MVGSMYEVLIEYKKRGCPKNPFQVILSGVEEIINCY